MAKRIEVPRYGTMIGIDELSALTGIPKATIRIWRREEYRHLTRFVPYKFTGRDVWYRLDEVEDWLVKNGRAAGTTFEPVPLYDVADLPNVHTLPLGTPVDPKKAEGLAMARSITLGNWYGKYSKMFKDGTLEQGNWLNFMNKYADDIAKAWFKDEPVVPFAKHGYPLNQNYPILMWAKMPIEDTAPEQDRYNFTVVTMLRLVVAELNGTPLTVEDVAALDLGSVFDK